MNNNIYLRAIAISLVSNNGKFSYSQTGEMYSKVSSYQVKRWLDKNTETDGVTPSVSVFKEFQVVTRITRREPCFRFERERAEVGVFC